MNDKVNKTQLNKLRDLIDKNKIYLDKKDSVKENDIKKNSMGLSMAVLMEYLALNQDEAFDALTDGGNDCKFDAFYFNDEGDLKDLIIVQSKYKLNDGDTDTIDEDQIKLCIENCKKFLIGDSFLNANPSLRKKIDEYRKLLDENGNPAISIKLFYATNGIIHESHKSLPVVKSALDNNIFPIFVDATEFGFTASVESGEINVNLKDLTDKTDSIFDIEDKFYSGIIVSCSIKEIMDFYKNTGKRSLLNGNVRYLIKSSPININIKNSFINDPKRFCYLHNGITMVCSNYKISPTGTNFCKLEVERPSIINGGQTMVTLFNLYDTKNDDYKTQFDKAKILLRVYRVPDDYSLLIAQATNSQNPISNVDLKSNDLPQEKAKLHFSKHGIGLLTKLGEDVAHYDDTITNESLLQVYASLYVDDPALAKLSKTKIFNKYYPQVFNEKLDVGVLKKLYRCYQIYKYISQQIYYDKAKRQNGFYSIVYTMRKDTQQILNEDIPETQIQTHFNLAFSSAIKIIDKIIEKKQSELKSKFSLNNLFKSREIKDLIDIMFEENATKENNLVL